MSNEQKLKQSWNTLPWTSNTCDEENILNLVHWRKRDFRYGGLEVDYTIVSRNPPPRIFLQLNSLHLESILEETTTVAVIEDGFLFRRDGGG